MSGNIDISALSPAAVSRKTLRYALGIMLMFAIVFTYNWPAAFLTIIIGNGFFLGPKPTFKFALDYVSKFTLGWLFSVLISYLFLDYYVVYMLVIGLVMLHVYYADSSVISPILKVALCIMNMVVPLMSLKSIVFGATLGFMLIVGSMIALLIAFILFSLIPDIETDEPQDDSHAAAPSISPGPTKSERFYLALKSLAALYPLLLLFFFFDMQSDALILVYIALFAAMPGFADDLSLGKLIIKTTLYGGTLAFLMYEILLLVPLFTFFMLLVFTLSLFAGYQLFTGGKYSLSIQKGFSATVFIFGGAANSIDIDIEGKVWIRVFQMTFFAIYLVLAFKLFDKWFPQKEKSS